MQKTLIFLVLFCKIAFAQNVHSHNDYLQKKPFHEAYDAGVASIEVDIFLKNNKLYVAHDESEINLKNTLEKMYLKPIEEILKKKKDSDFQLLIDIKTEALPTLKALLETLKKYPLLLASSKNKNGVRLLISGNRPNPTTYSTHPSYILFDHQSLRDLPDLDKSKIGLVSFSFKKFTDWDGKSSFLENDKNKLVKVISEVHQLGYKIRFWASPDTEIAWKSLAELDVDFINTDSPRKCVGYFLDKPKK
jgi:alkaline phosphatase